MARLFALLVATALFTSACAPMMRLSPKEETLILLPETSSASVTGRFQREERQTYWFHQAFTGEIPTPVDTLARTAGNRPIRNVKVGTSPDWLHFSLKFAGAVGAWALMATASPTTEPYGLWAYWLVVFAVPEAVINQVEGDFAGDEPASSKVP